MSAHQRPPQCVVCMHPVWECRCGKALVDLGPKPASVVEGERPDYRTLKVAAREHRDQQIMLEQSRVKPLPYLYGPLDAPESMSFEYEHASRERVRENIITAWWGTDSALDRVDAFVEGGKRPGKIMSRLEYRIASILEEPGGPPQWLFDEIEKAAKLSRKRKRVPRCPAKRPPTFTLAGTAACR